MAILESCACSEVVNKRRGPRVRWGRDCAAGSADMSAVFSAGLDIGTMEKFAENEQKIDSIFYRSLTLFLSSHTSVPLMLRIYDP
ncbi:MAG: hypothetical protein F4X87_10945 [Chloroflexi bacterium]|nr:hypothetical protein [Chloroflexota bacterium]